jgi:hypothetical protein
MITEDIQKQFIAFLSLKNSTSSNFNYNNIINDNNNFEIAKNENFFLNSDKNFYKKDNDNKADILEYHYNNENSEINNNKIKKKRKINNNNSNSIASARTISSSNATAKDANDYINNCKFKKEKNYKKDNKDNDIDNNNLLFSKTSKREGHTKKINQNNFMEGGDNKEKIKEDNEKENEIEEKFKTIKEKIYNNKITTKRTLTEGNSRVETVDSSNINMKRKIKFEEEIRLNRLKIKKRVDSKTLNNYNNISNNDCFEKVDNKRIDIIKKGYLKGNLTDYSSKDIIKKRNTDKDDVFMNIAKKDSINKIINGEENNLESINQDFLNKLLREADAKGKKKNSLNQRNKINKNESDDNNINQDILNKLLKEADEEVKRKKNQESKN